MGHRTALQSSADDSSGDARLDAAARTAKRARLAASEHTRARRAREDRTADQRSSAGAMATVDTPRAGVRGPAAGRQPSRPRTAARRGSTSARRGTNRVPGPDEDRPRRREFSHCRCRSSSRRSAARTASCSGSRHCGSPELPGTLCGGRALSDRDDSFLTTFCYWDGGCGHLSGPAWARRVVKRPAGLEGSLLVAGVIRGRDAGSEVRFRSVTG
jgi:hypothetical protein